MTIQALRLILLFHSLSRCVKTRYTDKSRLLVHQDSPHWKAKGQCFEVEQVETKDRNGKKITTDGCYVVLT